MRRFSRTPRQRWSRAARDPEARRARLLELAPVDRTFLEPALQLREQLCISLAQVLVGVVPLLALLPSRLRQRDARLAGTRRRELEHRVGALGADVREPFRRHRGEDQLRLRLERQDGAPTRLAFGVQDEPVAALAQVDLRVAPEPRLQTFLGGERL